MQLTGRIATEAFFEYFAETTLIAEAGGARIGFLGLLPPAPSTHADIHFVGVHPDSRQAGAGRALYKAFFDLACSANRTMVCCVTSPVNRRSVPLPVKQHLQTRLWRHGPLQDSSGTRSDCWNT